MARIQDASRHYNRGKQWAEPLNFTKLGVLFSILALLDASIGIIGLWFQCHSHTLMIRHPLRLLWANPDRRCNRGKQWAKPLHFTELDVLFSILALLDASIGIIGLWFQSYRHTLMIRHQFWSFWANPDRRCNRGKQWANPLPLIKLGVFFSILALLHASIEMTGLWFQCHSYDHFEEIRIVVERRQHFLSDVFAKNLAILEQSSLPHVLCPKISVKIAWHELNDMLISSAISVIVIRRLFKIIFSLL